LLFSQWSAISYGDESPLSEPESILAKYHEIEKDLEIISGIIPLYVESSVNKNTPMSISTALSSIHSI
jgi:hypothetical protein